jgi:hypothetical protein
MDTPRCLYRGKMVAWRLFRIVVCVFLALSVFANVGARADDSSNLHWKPVDGSQIKLDDKVPLTWGVFQLEKKKQPNLALVLLGHRYILVDSKARLAYVVFLTDIHAEGDGFSSGNLALASHVIPSVDWTEHDIGPAEEIRLTLEDYGHTLSVQLPHPLDIRLGIY